MATNHSKIYCTLIIINFIFSLIFIHIGDSQKVRYATRFRNFSAADTGYTRLVNFSIFQHNMEHRLSFTMEAPHQDVSVTSGEVRLERCSLENFGCEYFQTWKFPTNIDFIFFMKNQIWTPMFTSMKPKAKLSNLKKGVYVFGNCTLDADKTVAFYADVTKYFFRVQIAGMNKKKDTCILVNLDMMIFEYIDKGKRKN